MKIEINNKTIEVNKKSYEMVEQVAWMLKLRDEKFEFLKRTDLSEYVIKTIKQDIYFINLDLKKILELD